MTARELQTLVGPDQWPEVDELLNDIRRDAATQMQALQITHDSAIDALHTQIADLRSQHDAALDTKDAEARAAVAANDVLEKELQGFKAIIDKDVLPAAQALVAKLAQDRNVDAFLTGIVPVMDAATKGPKERALAEALAAKAAAEAKIAALQA